MPNRKLCHKKSIWQLRDERIAHAAHSARKSAYRYTQRFWTDLLDDKDFALAELIEALKAAGEFASTVKRGVFLVASLDAGHMDELLNMFPWVKSKILKSVEDLLDRRTKDLQEQIHDLQRQLEGASIGYKAEPLRPSKPATIRADEIFVDDSDSDDAWGNLANGLDW